MMNEHEHDDKDFNLDSFEQEFEQEWDNDNETDIPNEDVVEGDVEETEVEETEEPEETEPEEVDPPIHDEDAKKRDRAFADIRRQAQENQKYADFISQLAEQNGVSPQEIIERFEQRKLEEQAESENVPVEVLKRLNSLEDENRSFKEQSFVERFNSEVDQVVAQNQLKDTDVQQVFQYMHEKGYVVDGKPTIPFEDAFFLANRQTIIQREVEQTRQQELSEKQKRQRSSALPSGNNVSQTDDLDSEVDAYIKNIRF